jgi:hypothetical protein
VRSGPGEARTILLFHIISARPSKQSRMVHTFLKVYMEFGSYFLFLQEQIKDIIIRGWYNPLWTGILTGAQLTLSRHSWVVILHCRVLGVHKSLWVGDRFWRGLCSHPWVGRRGLVQSPSDFCRKGAKFGTMCPQI